LEIVVGVLFAGSLPFLLLKQQHQITNKCARERILRIGEYMAKIQTEL